MKLIDSYDGSNAPFEGDRTLLWSSLPAGAKVSKATLTLTPVSASGGASFEEEIELSGGLGDFGATLAASGGAGQPLEIDFHKPRTLVSIKGTPQPIGILQIDMGGLYVAINNKGAIKTPTDPTDFTTDATGALPSLTVARFRITPAAADTATATAVTVRSVPSNINVRLGKMAPFWPRIGDLTAQDSSPDFADLLEVFLRAAPVVNGFYAIPLVVHSDTIARLKASVEVEFIQQASIMPDGINEAVLPFDFSSVPKSQPGVLSVDLPPNARVVPGTTAARILGAFDDSRVVFGPTGEIKPDGTVSIASNDSQAVCFSVDSATSVTGVDLLVAPQPPGVDFAVDLRADLDGKPDSLSLLGAPAQVTVPSRPDKLAAWVNVPLPQELHLQAGSKARYWLVLQSLQGTAEWSVKKSAAGTVMQHTQDGGLSWRETAAPPAASPPSGLFRLRQVPASFQVPVELQIGSGDQAQRVKMDRFQPLNRVDFNLDFPEVADGFNTYLAQAAPPACSEAEHLANGNFEQWVAVGNELGPLIEVNVSQPGETAAESQPDEVGAIAISADGTIAYLGMDTGEATRSQVLGTLDVLCNRAGDQTLDLALQSTPESILLYPDGSKAVVSGSGAHVLIDLNKSLRLLTGRFSIFGMVFSADGQRVYAMADKPSRQLYSLTVTELEQALANSALPANPQSGPPVSLKEDVVAMAVDSTRLYVLTDRKTGSSQGALLIFDQLTLAPAAQSVDLIKSPLAFALTPDGSQAVIANGDSSATVLAFADRSTREIQFDAKFPSPAFAAVVLSPDGARAFVACTPDNGSSALHIIDLNKKSVVKDIEVDQNIAALAITPQGDQIYLGIASAPALYRIPIGTSIPADWFVTSGIVVPLCEPFLSSTHIVLGLASASAADAATPNAGANTEEQSPVSAPGSISQVVPISGGCAYEFSFEGLSNDPNAVAEVLWRGQNCQSEKTDQVPIPQFVPREKSRLQQAAVREFDIPQRIVAGLKAAATPGGSERSSKLLVPTRVRLSAPPTATAAEVRFTVPDTAAAIAAVSLAGAPQALQNGDFQVTQQQPLAESWTLSPPTARGVLTAPEAGHVVLRNTGLSTADLVQVAAVAAKQKFELDFSGQVATTVAATAATGSPQLKLRWLKADGTETGKSLSQDITSSSFSSHPMAGEVADNAAQVEVHLSLPPGTALTVDHVSLRLHQATAVLVSFVAQSRGELRVQGASVGYEIAPSLPPPAPPEGLCSPTPPGQAPGQQPDESCHCSCCQDTATMTQAAPALTPSGKPMMVGKCSTCGNQLVRGGGKAGQAQPLPLRVARHGALPRFPVPARRAVPPPALTDVMGIGKNRALQLKSAGITSVKDLAAATPEFVAESVHGVTVNNARSLIEHAKARLAASGLEK